MSPKRHVQDKAWLKARVCKIGSCWEWALSCNRLRWGGYGQVGTWRDGKKVKMRAHRFAWELYNGSIPEGLLVLHRCDNPRCVNPAHLFLGTNADNSRDRDNKGRRKGLRHACGEQNNSACLTEEIVRELRQRWDHENKRKLVDELGVVYNTAWLAVKRVTWKHVK